MLACYSVRAVKISRIVHNLEIFSTKIFIYSEILSILKKNFISSKIISPTIYVYVCMCVYVTTCVYVCICDYMCTCMIMYECVCMYVCMYVCVCICDYMCVCMYM